MNDSSHEHENHQIRQHYERHSYPAVVALESHPQRVAATAMLYGCRPPDPVRASILELGCARGFNLAAIAKSLPQSPCLGLDISGPQIDEARRLHDGLANLRFEVADLLDLDLGQQRFDYIIAHGVFSWVPDEVKLRLLEIGRDHLTPNGLMYVSYNCYPAWSLREGLAKLGLLEMTGKADEADVQRGLAALDVLDRAVQGAEQTPYHALLSATIRSIRQQPASMFAFDEFAPINDPCYFVDFVDLAAAHDMAYVADAKLDVDWHGSYPEASRKVWAEAKLDRLRALQQADWLAMRSFRQSIICHKSQAERITAIPQTDRLRDLWVHSPLEPVLPLPASATAPVAYRPRGQQQHGPLLQIEPGSLQTLLERIQKLDGAVPLHKIVTERGGDSEAELLASALQLACRGFLDLSVNTP